MSEGDSGLPMSQIRPGDRVLLSILAADFAGAMAGAMVHLTMIWWVLGQDVPDNVVGLMVLAIFIPLNLGVLLSGVAVNRYGSRRLLILSKLVAIGGASACFLLLAANVMTLPLLALVAIITYGAMSPSVAADIARVPALTRMARRRLAGFHAANGVSLVLGQVCGMAIAGVLAERHPPEHSVAIGILLVAVSAAITYFYFPRDRIRPRDEMSTWQEIRRMTRDVLARLDGKDIGLGVVIATAATISVAEGMVEVILPLAYRATDLPPTALSAAYVITVIAGVLGAFWAQAKYDSVRLLPTITMIGGGVVVLTLLGMWIGGAFGIMLAVVTASIAAWASGTLTVTALQDRMPVSLQAQAISLWQAFVLAAGAVTILITGQIGALGMPFMILLALVTLVTGLVLLRRG